MEFRISTLCLGVAAVALLAAYGVDALGHRLSISTADTVVAILVWVVFPCTAVIGGVAAVIFLVWKRRWQFLIEAGVATVFIAYLLRWEAP